MLPANPLLNATAPAGSHLPVALLRQYAAGTLAPAAQHRVEAHTLACPRCADILEGFMQTPAATTDQALAQLQQRLRKRVQQPTPTARPMLGQRQQHRWLAPQLAAAATLLLGLVAGGWWTWQQRHPSPATSQPIATTEAPATTPIVSVAPTHPTGPARPAAAPPKIAKLSRPAAAARRPTRPAPAHQSTPPTPKHLVAAAPMPTATTGRSTASESYDATPAPILAERTDTAAITNKTAALTSAPAAASVAAAPRAKAAMPAAPALAPAPMGGYPALREKLRRAAAEFVPEAPEQRLSGTVQLRLTIGPDGKIQQVNVVRSLRADYDAEAQELVCDGPGWVPGVSGGRRAVLTVDIAVPF